MLVNGYCLSRIYGSKKKGRTFKHMPDRAITQENTSTPCRSIMVHLNYPRCGKARGVHLTHGRRHLLTAKAFL